MPHNRFYIDAPLDINSSYSVSDDQCHYLRKVMRAKVGEHIEVINGKGLLAKATVLDIGKDHFEVEITECSKSLKPNFRLTLAISLLKPSHLEYALEKACELGASRFFLFEATLSEKKAVSSTYLQRLQAIVLASTKQCGRLFLPEIYVKQSLLDCLGEGQNYFCDLTEKAEPIDNLDLSNDVTVFVGPESGFTDSEIATLSKHCNPVTLHHNTLRAETAVVAATLLFINKHLTFDVKCKK